jgi:heavy metal sensor kinase
MGRSLRARLVLWYGGILLAVLALFAGFLFSRQAWTTWDRLDRQLASTVHYLDATLAAAVPQQVRLDHGVMANDGVEDKKGPKRKKDNPPPRRDDQDLDALDIPVTMQGSEPGDDRMSFAVWRPEGTLLKASPGLEVEPLPEAATELSWISRDGYRQASLRGETGMTILVRQPIGRLQQQLRNFFWLLTAAGAVVLVVGLAGGWWLSGRILQPLGAIAQTASKISASHLDERIDDKSLDVELVELAQVLNAMFARLREEFDRQARFTADASHELRTPLAVLLGQVELALSRPRSVEEYQAALKSCQQAATRMRSLVDGLLVLARADADRLEVQKTPLDLRPLLRDALDQFLAPAEKANIRLLADWPEQPVRVLGDRLFLSRVLTNLLANALRYTPSGGGIRLAVTTEERAAVLKVRDSGCGIPPEHREKIFTRFYRVDDARARDTGGVGLGLAICKSIIIAHGGSIDVESEPGQGSTFIVRLPLAT